MDSTPEVDIQRQIFVYLAFDLLKPRNYRPELQILIFLKPIIITSTGRINGFVPLYTCGCLPGSSYKVCFVCRRSLNILQWQRLPLLGCHMTIWEKLLQLQWFLSALEYTSWNHFFVFFHSFLGPNIFGLCCI